MTAKRSVPAEGGRYYRTGGDKLSKTVPKPSQKPAATPDTKGK